MRENMRVFPKKTSSASSQTERAHTIIPEDLQGPDLSKQTPAKDERENKRQPIVSIHGKDVNEKELSSNIATISENSDPDESAA